MESGKNAVVDKERGWGGERWLEGRDRVCEVADDGPWWKLGDHLVPRRAPRAVALCEPGDLGAPLEMPPHSSTRAPLSLLIASPDLLFLAEQGRRGTFNDSTPPPNAIEVFRTFCWSGPTAFPFTHLPTHDIPASLSDSSTKRRPAPQQWPIQQANSLEQLDDPTSSCLSDLIGDLSSGFYRLYLDDKPQDMSSTDVALDGQS